MNTAASFTSILRAHCHEQRGRQAELARHLGTTRQHVQEWTQGRKLPDHTATIGILRWLPDHLRLAVLKEEQDASPAQP